MGRQLKIILFLTLVTTFAGALKYPPSFLREPAPSLLIEPCQSLVLHCEATGHPKPMYNWKKNGLAFNFRNNSQIIQKPDNGTLEFINPESADVGVYTCIAENQHGKAISNRAIVQMTGFAPNSTTARQAPTWIKTPNDTAAGNMKRIAFECIAQGVPEPTVKWLKNGQLLRPNDRITIEGTTMVIDPIHGDIDTAVYQCNASNEVGFSVANFYLNALQFMPTIIHSPQREMKVMSKSDVELLCIADGSPMPTIRWEKDNYPISNGSKFIVNGGYLKVLNVSPKDAGVYRCIASNKAGFDFKSTKFTILNETKIIAPPENQSLPLGANATLRCNAIADANLALKVDWKFNDLPLDLSKNSHISRCVDGSLQVNGAADSDAGYYTCIASTDLDFVNVSAFLTIVDVPDPPKITKVTCNGILASIEWTPRGDNGSPILSYDIQLSHNFEPHVWSNVFSNVSVSEQSTQRHIIPLKPWMRYSFRVLARNALGLSKPSVSFGFCSAKSMPPFKHPENVTVRADGPGTLVVSWNEMNQTEHNADGFRYKVFWRSFDDPEDHWHCRKIFDWQETETTLEDLGIYKRYRIRVESRNNKGKPGQSAEEIIACSGEAKPLKAPRNLKLVQVVSPTSAIITWDPVSPKSVQGLFRGYKAVITSKDGGGSEQEECLKAEETTVTLNSLKPNALNLIKVMALNSAYESDPSNEIQVLTPKVEA